MPSSGPDPSGRGRSGPGPPGPESDRWLVVGLGNPDGQYAGTRHNIGAACVALLAERLGVRPGRHRSGAVLADGVTPTRRVPISVGRPGGYMNESGGPVQRALAFYSLGLEQLVVVHDEIDLPLGALRLKLGGGTAGHNGLRDIERRCGGRGFHRVRLGVGRPPGRTAAASYVLKPFARRERDEVDLLVERGADAVLDLVEEGLDVAQNRHHGRDPERDA